MFVMLTGGSVLSPSEARFEIADRWLDCLDGLEMTCGPTAAGGVREQWGFLVDRSTRLLAVLASVDPEAYASDDRRDWFDDVGRSAIELIRFGAEIVIRGDHGSQALTSEEGLSPDGNPLGGALGLLVERKSEMSRLCETGRPESASAACVERLDTVATGMNPLRGELEDPLPEQAEIGARYRAHDDSEFRREESWSDALADWQSYAGRRLPGLIGRGEEGTLPFLAAIASLDSTILGRTVGFYDGVATFLPGGPPLLPEDEGGGS